MTPADRLAALHAALDRHPATRPEPRRGPGRGRRRAGVIRKRLAAGALAGLPITAVLALDLPADR